MGKYNVVVYGKGIHYTFDIQRKITVLTGNSGTGKTTLVDLINDLNSQSVVRRYNKDGDLEKTSVDILTVSDKGFDTVLMNRVNSIIVVDEGLIYAYKNFFDLLMMSNNYFILITRMNFDRIKDSLAPIPYLMFEIYRIASYTKNKHTFDSFRNVYTFEPINLLSPYITLSSNTIIITEDSKSGYEFFVKAFPNNVVYSADGKNNFLNIIKTKSLYNKPTKEHIEFNGTEHLLFIIDSAGFGSCINRLMFAITETNFQVDILAPESFEFLLLQVVDVVGRNHLSSIVNYPYDYLDVTITDCGDNTIGEDNYYGSWEIFFTNLLIKKTLGTSLQYTKSGLNNAYLKYIPKVLELLNANFVNKSNHLSDTSLFK